MSKRKKLIVIMSIVLALSLGTVLSYLLTDGWWNSGKDVEYTDLDGAEIIVYASDNPTLPFDVKAFVADDKATIFLPADTDLENICYTLTDDMGDPIRKNTVDLSNGKTYNGTYKDSEITMLACQATLPSVHLAIEPDTPIIDVFSDKSKNTVSYGEMAVYAPALYAEKYGCETFVKTEDTKAETPGSVRLKGRGHSSWMYLDKKSLTVKTESGLELLGMNKNRDWVLVSNHYDRSLIRNTLIYDIYEKNAKGFSVDSRQVHLFIDGEYYGLYLLTEKIEVSGDKVDIEDLGEINEALNGEEVKGGSKTELLDSGVTVKYWPKVNSPDDVTGGYLIEIDLETRGKSEPSYVKTSRGTLYVIKCPEYASYEEAVYIGEYLENMEDAIYSEDGCDNDGKHFSEYVDLESLAMVYVIDEISMNIDGGRTSSYFYKDSDKKDGKLYRGPIWDYDLALGNYKKYAKPKTLEIYTYYCFKELLEHPEFREETARQYEKIAPYFRELCESGLDEELTELKPDADMNFQRWSEALGVTIGVVSHPETGESFEGAVGYIKDFLEERLDWLDENLYNEILLKK